MAFCQHYGERTSFDYLELRALRRVFHTIRITTFDVFSAIDIDAGYGQGRRMNAVLIVMSCFRIPPYPSSLSMLRLQHVAVPFPSFAALATSHSSPQLVARSSALALHASSLLSPLSGTSHRPSCLSGPQTIPRLPHPPSLPPSHPQPPLEESSMFCSSSTEAIKPTKNIRSTYHTCGLPASCASTSSSSVMR